MAKNIKELIKKLQSWISAIESGAETEFSPTDSIDTLKAIIRELEEIEEKL